MAKKKNPVKAAAPEDTFKNGMTDAILGVGNPGGFGTQVNQVSTLMQNNRWYLISNMRQLLSEMYVENGLVQTIVDVPVDDGLRGGLEIKSKQLEEEQIQKLQIEIEKEDDINEIGQAMKWNRLFGGAGVIIITDQDPELPLQVSLINEQSKLEFRSVDMWELFYDRQGSDGSETSLGEEKFEFYNYYGVKLHKSRVMRMKGIKAPSFVRPRLRGWGFSVIESLVKSINQYLKAINLTFEVLDEFKLDIFKIKGMTNSLLMANGEQKIRQRVALANTQKNFQNALTMDSEDDYVQKQLSFAGLSEVMSGLRMQIASDLRMPMTKIFGISATGFSSGEDDIENYNAMVESQIRSKCKFDLIKMVELRCQQMFGFVPDDISVEFKPLRVLSSEAQENVKTQQFSRLLQAVQAGHLTEKEFKEACNKEKLLGIQLDTSVDKIEVEGEDTKEPAAPAAKKSVTAAPEAKS